jgi:GTP cyclohydrolase I
MNKNKKEFENNFKNILKLIGENPDREGLIDTPSRVYKSFKFLCKGYEENPEDILKKAMFSTDNEEMVIVKDIEFYSLCEHHVLPIVGKATVAYIPNGKVVGLSKIPRVVETFSRRLQIQEQLTEQIALAIQNSIEPKGVAVFIDARHFCMEMRGVEKVCSSTITTSYKGLFKDNKEIKKEFLEYLKVK